MKRSRFRIPSKRSRAGALPKGQYNSEISIAEIVTGLSLIAALFPGVVLYISYFHMNVFFNASGLNLDFIPISISNSLDIFKHYTPLSYFYIGFFIHIPGMYACFFSWEKEDT